MNTSVGYHQAPRPPRVPLDEVSIKLYPEGFNQEFDADGIDVGAGGISMRSAVVPQVGSKLRCEFDTPSGGPPISTVGLVVWAQETGPYVGEFGVRFTELEELDQDRIEVLIQRWHHDETSPTVRLQLDGVESAIVATVASESDNAIRVEQSLPFLSIGTAVDNTTAGRRGRLEGIELTMDDSTPKLVLSIGYEVEGRRKAAESVLPAAELAVFQQPGVKGPEEGFGQGLFADDDRVVEVDDMDTLPDRLSDTPQVVRYDRDTDKAEKAKALLQRLRDGLGMVPDHVASVMGPMKHFVMVRCLPSIRQGAVGAVQTQRRFVAALGERLSQSPRRKQVPRSQVARARLQAKNTRRGSRRIVRWVALGIAVATAGWLGYQWTLRANHATEAEASTPDAAAAPVASANDEAADERATAPAIAADARPAPMPATQATTAEISRKVRGTAFGEALVPGGEKFVLQMSNPVKRLEGVVEEDGFVVMIPGSLSLSKAGPIAVAHPDVEFAGILNRGEFSELTLRFVAGRRPAYRVAAQGATLEITIAR